MPPSIVVDANQTRTAELINTSWTELGRYVVNPSDVILEVDMQAFAKRNNGDAARWAQSATFKRHDGGDLDQIGDVASLLGGITNGKQADTGALLWDFKVETDGDELVFSVKANADTYAGVLFDAKYTLPG